MTEVEAPLRAAPIVYTVLSTVTSIFERFSHHHQSGVGEAAIFEQRSLGWYITIKGSYEAIFLGNDRPDFAIDDAIKITFQKVL